VIMGLGFLIDEFRSWRERRSAMTEMRRLGRQPDPLKDYRIEVSLNAMKAGVLCKDAEATVQAFNQFRILAPQRAITSATAIRALLAVGKTEFAETVLEEGLRKYPEAFVLMQLHADAATQRRDWSEAARRWGIVRRKFPDDFWACYWGAVALKELNRFDEADKLMERAIARNPKHRESAAEYPRIAERRGDEQETLRRWELMRNRIEHHAAWVGSARTMCRLGREGDAIEMLTEAHMRFQSRPEPLVELAEIYQRRGPNDEAARRWQVVREHFPHIEQGYTKGAMVLRALGRGGEADALILRYSEGKKLSQSDLSE
jgi:tetratricopeptide (TPR) repeat protein